MKTGQPTPGKSADSSACDRVFFGIQQALEARQLEPGQRLVEVDLAEAYGVSRNSVREALQRLATQGIVELVRHKGGVIRQLTLRETLDVLEVAERMTGLLARAAARSVAQGTRPTDLAQVVVQFAEMAERAAPPHPATFAKVRRLFYRALLGLANSRELSRLFPTIQMPVVHAQHRIPALQQWRLQDYRAIAEAVLQGEESLAEERAVAHVRRVASIIEHTHAAAAAAGEAPGAAAPPGSRPRPKRAAPA